MGRMGDGVAEADRRAMGESACAPSCCETQPARRPTSSERPALLHRDSVDFVDGVALERAAPTVWQFRDLLAPAARMGREWRVAGDVAHLLVGPERPPEDSLGRMFRGWQFRSCQKRGLCVGKTKRGKGTKWMVLVDGQGTPMGAHLDSASPAEVKLLETTLATVRVRRTHRPGRPRCRPDRLILDPRI